MATKAEFSPPKKTEGFFEEKKEAQKKENATPPEVTEGSKVAIPDSGNGRQMIKHEGIPKDVADEKQTVPDSEVSTEPLPPQDEGTLAAIKSEDNETNEENDKSGVAVDVHKEESEEYVDASTEFYGKADGAAAVENGVIEEVLLKEEAPICGGAQTGRKQSKESSGSQSDTDESDEEEPSITEENETDTGCQENADSQFLVEGEMLIFESDEGPQDASSEVKSTQTDGVQVPEKTDEEESAAEVEILLSQKLTLALVFEDGEYDDGKESGDEAPVTDSKETVEDMEEPEH